MPEVGLLTIPGDTPKEIARVMGNVPCWNVKNGELPPNNTQLDFLIRYGAIDSVPWVKAKRVLNKASAIRNSSNKPLARAMLQKAGIPTPVFDSFHFPVIGRPKFHTRGHGFYLCKNKEDVLRAKAKGANYFSQLYNKTKEWRVHVGKKRTILVSEKQGSLNRARWNWNDGAVEFRHLKRNEWLNNNELREVVLLAKQARRVFGLDVAAVDIMGYPQNNKFPKFVVVEINTAPSLSDLPIKLYARYFDKLISGYYDKERNEREE